MTETNIRDIVVAKSRHLDILASRDQGYRSIEVNPMSGGFWMATVYLDRHRIIVEGYDQSITGETTLSLPQITSKPSAWRERHRILLQTAESIYRNCCEEDYEEFVRKYKLENEI